MFFFCFFLFLGGSCFGVLKFWVSFWFSGNCWVSFLVSNILALLGGFYRLGFPDMANSDMGKSKQVGWLVPWWLKRPSGPLACFRSFKLVQWEGVSE